MTVTKTAGQLADRARSAIGMAPSGVERALSQLEEAGPAGKRLAERMAPGAERLEDALERAGATAEEAVGRARATLEDVVGDALEDERVRTWGPRAAFALGGLIVGFVLGWMAARRGSITVEMNEGIAQAPREARRGGAIPPTGVERVRERAGSGEGDGQRS